MLPSQHLSVLQLLHEQLLLLFGYKPSQQVKLHSGHSHVILSRKVPLKQEIGQNGQLQSAALLLKFQHLVVGHVGHLQV